MPSSHLSFFRLALVIGLFCSVPAQLVPATEPGLIAGIVPTATLPSSSMLVTASTDTAYFTNDTINHVIGLNYTKVLAAVFFIVDGNITPSSLFPPGIILGWAFDGPYTNILASPLGPGPNGFPSFGSGPLFSYTGKGKIVWAEASDTLAFLVPVEFPGGAYHGCGWQWSGNVDCDFQQSVDISDITMLIDFLFISQTSLCCEGEANCDGLPGIDIGDVTRLIDFLFISRTPPSPCR